MNKDQTAWLVIRSMGLVILLACAAFLYEFLLNLAAVRLSAGIPHEGEPTLRLPNLRWDPLLHSAALFAFSFYFLRHGKALHRLLMKEDR